MTKSISLAEYAEQIRRCAQALSLAKNTEVAGDLAGSHLLDRVKMFTDGNLEKRFDKLMDQFEFLLDEFDDLEQNIVDYVRSVPLNAYDTACTDAERFLKYLEATRILTAEQRDFVTCQQSRYSLELLATEHRLEHIRFQELSSLVEALTPEWGKNPKLRVHFNPLRVWATFQTLALLDEDDETSATIVFYPVKEEIRTAVLEGDGLTVAEFLESHREVSWDDPAWGELGLSCAAREEICCDFAEIGLAAFA